MIRRSLGRFVPVGPRDSLALLLILAVPTGAFAQSADDRPGQLQFKLSGYGTLLVGALRRVLFLGFLLAMHRELDLGFYVRSEFLL